MSNRLLAIFILVLIIGSIFGTYWYFFVANVASVVFTTGKLDNVNVTLMTEFKYEKTQTCTNSCIFDGIPPVSISVTAKKEGYDTYKDTFDLHRGEKKVITISLHKTVILLPRDTTNTDKISLIKLKKNLADDSSSGGLQPLGTFGGVAYAYSLENGFSLISYADDGTKKIITTIPDNFSIVTLNDFDGIILLKKENGESGILEIESGIYTTLKQISSVEYVKKGSKPNSLSIRTKDGVYSLDRETGEIAKDGMYDDYVPVGSGKILGLLGSGSSSKKILLNFPDDGKTLLILQDIVTHERKVVYSTSDALVGVIVNAGKIYVINAFGESREVKNLEF